VHRKGFLIRCYPDWSSALYSNAIDKSNLFIALSRTQEISIPPTRVLPASHWLQNPRSCTAKVAVSHVYSYRPISRRCPRSGIVLVGRDQIAVFAVLAIQILISNDHSDCCAALDCLVSINASVKFFGALMQCDDINPGAVPMLLAL
jgi:hypothetical protein